MTFYQPSHWQRQDLATVLVPRRLIIRAVDVGEDVDFDLNVYLRGAIAVGLRPLGQQLRQFVGIELLGGFAWRYGCQVRAKKHAEGKTRDAELVIR